MTHSEVAIIRSNLNEDEYDLEAGLREFNLEQLTSLDVFPAVIDAYKMAYLL